MGRPQGELRGRTAQANALAQWLRTVIGHVPVRELEASLYVGKSSWAAYRSGSTLITEKLLAEVVERYIPDPAMRERQRAEGLRLLAEAEEAGQHLKDTGRQAVLVVRERPREPLAVALLRLDDARLLQMEAVRKLADSEKQCALLGSTVKVLQDRCLVLEQERDRALEDRARLQRELDLSLEYRRQAGEQLEHARHARSAAERLALTADEHVMRERMVVERQAAGATPAGDPADARRGAAGEDLGLAPLDQIEAVLRASREQLEEQDEELDDLRGRMGDERADSSQEPPPIVRGSLLDNRTAGQQGVVQPGPADGADRDAGLSVGRDVVFTPPAWYTPKARTPAQSEAELEAELEEFTIDYTPPAWYTAGTLPLPQPVAPVSGPGHRAVLRYRAADGSVQHLVRHSAPGVAHPEWQLFHALRVLNVAPERVLGLHTELEPCDLPGAYCARMVRETWPQAHVSYDVPYGGDLQGRQEGIRRLLAFPGRVRTGPDPRREPLPGSPDVPSGSGAESAAQKVWETFAPENIFRFALEDALRAGAPAVVREYVVAVGLPRDMGPFFWSQPQSGRPWPTLDEVAARSGVRAPDGPAVSLVVGHDFGRALGVQYGTAHIVAVPLEAQGQEGPPEPEPQLPPQFVNSGLPEFAHCIAHLGRTWPLRQGLTPEQAGRWAGDFQAALVELDPPALASPENWWSLLLEQMWDGLL
ncbi:SUKH-4 family immunity protein [Streptomyces sp. 4.24]|uniref:SUKH-4 family immunity protein n=1 Tax=Streptomyces tritrimontium TaxID=3406573 RepID=UPI003BB75514